ncbi:MAG: BatA domain-containing protein, partial [Nanoarchaeota archaeon]
MSFTDLILTWWSFAQAHLDNAGYLALIPILLVLLFWLVRHDFVKLAEDRESKAKRRRQQHVILALRSIVIIALVIALASPFIERQMTVNGDPSLNILVDHSDSMSVFPDDIGESLKSKLEGAIDVELQSIASGRLSPIGDGILNGVREGDTAVLVTDGQANLGASLGDVALFAISHNITFNAIQLVPKTDDAWVAIEGPDKTVENVETTLVVKSGWASKDTKMLHLTVLVDGKTVFDDTDIQTEHIITQKFGDGYHRIEARVTDDNVIADNNAFFKVVKVVPKPTVLLWSPVSGTPAEQLLRQVYDVTQVASLPVDLERYYSVVTNDVTSSAITNDDVTRLSDYASDGNGIVVIGGKNSYDKGGYKNSYFETLLPVVVGTPGKESGDVNVVVLIDASQSVVSD